MIPDQHAAFGITQARKKRKGETWKDLNLDELMKASKGPGRVKGAFPNLKLPR